MRQKRQYKKVNNNEKVIVPDKWLQELFEVLETYNFTIDENSAFDEELSIDPEMLGRIFENLLAEINPETGESARKSTGSYYTPRIIVDYMVDESLYLYLRNKTDIEEEKLRSLISYDLDDDSYTPLTEDEKEEIIAAIDALKILDPACGSGAFPMGALQKIVFILQQLDPNGQYWFKAQIKNVPVELRKNLEREHREKNFDYIRKLGVIRRNIFGVDIQPIATEISRLRCFLTLIVDQKVDDYKENRGIDPLPNLDFKFVTANSLVSLPGNDCTTETLEMFEDTESINKLKEIRDQFFNASMHERNELKLKFKDIQLEMSRHFNSVKSARADLTEQLLSWNPFVHKTTEWFDPDWMFGIKNTFDIVIGNPPYVGNKGHKEIFHRIQQTNLGIFYQRRMDLYYFFFHLTLNLLNSGGLGCFITTNYFFTSTSGTRLRKDLYRRSQILRIVNFNELKIFESAQGQHNAITILQKSDKKNKKCLSITSDRKGYLGEDEIKKLLDGKFNKKDQNELFGGDYIELSDSALSPIFDKFKSGTVLMSEICNINQGIVTGADKLSKKHIEKFGIKEEKGSGIFVLTESELVEKFLEKSDMHIKPWYKNRHIGQYFTESQTTESILYLKDKKEKQAISDMMLSHFKKYETLLTERLKVCRKNKFQWNIVSKWIERGEYYLLFYPRRQEIFESPKIVAPQRSPRNTFGYNEISWYAASDVFFITSKSDKYKLKYVLALLNSKLYYFWLFNKGKRKGSNLELTAKPLSEIPIKVINNQEQQAFISTVDKVLSITSQPDYDPHNPPEEQKALEKEIDHMVYQLYGLTKEEIELVEKSTKS